MSEDITQEQQAIIYEALGESFKKIVNDPRMKDANPDMFAHAWLSMAVYNVNVVGIRARRMLVSIASVCDSPELIGRAIMHQATGGSATFEGPKST